MHHPSVSPLSPKQERQLIFLVALVQFVNILDFIMVMPLGPDFALALDIPLNHIGIVAGSYTLAAAVAGLIAAPFLDMFSRKSAMLISLGGVVLATFACAYAWDLQSMIAMRVLAGIFGGQMFALSQAVIADYIPPERRGIAMGKVAGGFAVASIVGIPFGLEVASRFGWQGPFISTSIIGVLVLVIAWVKLPYHAPYITPMPLTARIRRLTSVLDSRLSIISLAMMGVAMMAGFMIIPNISSHFQFNLGYPRADLGLLYLCGGLLSFFGMRLSGKIMDKYSAAKANILFSLIVVTALILGFVLYPLPISPLIIFVCFMVGTSGRNVCTSALSSKVPAAEDRGAYMSLQSSIINFSSATGSYVSSLILTQKGFHLYRIEYVALIAMVLTLCVPLMVRYVERKLRTIHAPL